MTTHTTTTIITDLPEETPVTLMVPNEFLDLLKRMCMYLKVCTPNISPETLLLRLAQESIQTAEEATKDWPDFRL